MRTNEEILGRIEHVKESDWLGTATADLMVRLPFELAKTFLIENTTIDENSWVLEHQRPKERESILAEMLAYMPFAWDKANNERGISASRSMTHYSTWTWLIGEDLVDPAKYEYYGKDILVEICKRFGWDHTQWDDGIRTDG